VTMGSEEQVEKGSDGITWIPNSDQRGTQPGSCKRERVPRRLFTSHGERKSDRIETHGEWQNFRSNSRKYVCSLAETCDFIIENPLAVRVSVEWFSWLPVVQCPGFDSWATQLFLLWVRFVKWSFLIKSCQPQVISCSVARPLMLLEHCCLRKYNWGWSLPKIENEEE
jgi:hypothetical protein